MMFSWQLPLAAFDLGTLLFVFFFIIAGLVQMFRQRQTQTGNEDDDSEAAGSRPASAPPQSQRPSPPRPYTAEQEEIRKFLEALGKPKTSVPPPPRPVAPPAPPVLRPAPLRPAPRPLPVAQPARKPLPPATSEGTCEEEEEGEAPLVNIITGEKIRHEFQPLERVDLSKEMKIAEAEAAGAAMRAADVRRLLTQKTSVRQAVVLAEVIGQPKWQ